MPLSTHPVFKRPALERLLWRYMSFPKFASMITTGSLWFSNMHALAAEDPYEGILPAGNYAHREWKHERDIPPNLLRAFKEGDFVGKTGNAESDLAAYKALLDQHVDDAYNARKENYISCWHISDFESASMWQIYAERHFGIAIVSSINAIESALLESEEDIFAGCVQYIDYSLATLDTNSGFIPALHKRLSFSHENELRLLIWDYSASEMDVLVEIGGVSKVMKTVRPKPELDAIIPPAGKNISCDLSALIKTIYISPAAPRWFEEAVRSICTLAGLDKKITKSDLLTGPMR